MIMLLCGIDSMVSKKHALKMFCGLFKAHSKYSNRVCMPNAVIAIEQSPFSHEL